MNPFLLLTAAVAVSVLVIPLVRRFAPRLGLIDMPDPRKVHAVPIPRVGGWGITLGILAPLVAVLGRDPLVQSFLAGCLILFAFGIWDDARQIGHWAKFAGQLAAVAVVVVYGDLWVSRMPFLDAALPPALGKPFTVFALIGVINALNHSDGLDGLAGGEAILSLIALAILGYMADSALVLGISLATIGGIFGFLRYNSHPAWVFMGDCGSQVLGFTLGFLAVLLTQHASTALSAALPLLILGLPIADILSVLYQRARGGMNWFKATRNHVHHRLMQLGFDHYETVVIIYLMQACLVVSGVLVRYESDLTVTLLYVAAVTALFVALARAERGGWHVSRARGAQSPLARAIGRLKASRAVRDGPLLAIGLLTPAAMLGSAAWVNYVPRDFVLPAALLALVPLAQLVRPGLGGSAALRIAVYAAAISPGYLLISDPAAIPVWLQYLGSAVIVVLALAIVAYVRFSSADRFGTTPTDYLIACGIVALMVGGALEANSRPVVEVVLLATVLMYACEVLLVHPTAGRSRRVLQAATLGTLLVIAVRGLG